MSKVTSKAKKLRTKKGKDGKVYPVIYRSSHEHVCLTYLIMRSRSQVYTSTLQDVFNLAPLKFKKIERAEKALDLLVQFSCAVKAPNGEYFITQEGFNMQALIAQRPRRYALPED